MGDRAINRYAPSDVSVPGSTLRELLDERGMSQSELAARMGRPQKTISEIVNGKAAITPETALELESVLGVPASFWNAREWQYREYMARVEREHELEAAAEWAQRFPVAAMSKLGWIPKTQPGPDRVQSLLSFFGIASPKQFNQQLALSGVAFRKSQVFDSDEAATAGWLRVGVKYAESVLVEPFDGDRFIEVLQKIRNLTLEDPKVFCPSTQELCASAGVVVAFVPQMPKCRANGATRWLGPEKAVIQLSIRYRTDDHLWFTFFHEAGHILLHGKKMVFIEGLKSDTSSEETEANAFAADFLIPPSEFQEIRSRRPQSKVEISQFAQALGIAPGILVGRLQHEGLLPITHCNDLKRRLMWEHEAA